MRAECVTATRQGTFCNIITPTIPLFSFFPGAHVCNNYGPSIMIRKEGAINHSTHLRTGDHLRVPLQLQTLSFREVSDRKLPPGRSPLSTNRQHPTLRKIIDILLFPTRAKRNASRSQRRQYLPWRLEPPSNSAVRFTTAAAK